MYVVDKPHSTMICPLHNEPMILKLTSLYKYGNGQQRLFWSCPTWSKTKCEFTVGAHPDGKPLGLPANKRTKGARRETHKVMDEWMLRRKMTTAQAYAAIKRYFKTEVHIGELDETGCDAVQRFMLND